MLSLTRSLARSWRPDRVVEALECTMWVHMRMKKRGEPAGHKEPERKAQQEEDVRGLAETEGAVEPTAGAKKKGDVDEAGPDERIRGSSWTRSSLPSLGRALTTF